METTPDSRRVQSMQKRRIRILAEARRLLMQGGPEAINLRDVARLADVTVPTIYNLIGNKEELLVALFAEVLTEIESRVCSAKNVEPLAMSTAVVLEAHAIFAQDQDYYRSAFLAVEYLNQMGPHQDSVVRLYAWGEHLLVAGLVACKDAHWLRGKITPTLLGGLIQKSFRANLQAWAFRQITLEEFRDATLTDIYITLASDAVESFHARLRKNISALKVAPPRRRAQRPARS